MLKENGKKKHYKFIKCENCNKNVKIIQNEIFTISGIKYLYCPYCGEQILL